MEALDWLLEGDPAIRWQALRDLADADAETVAAERARVAGEGWGARLLALQGEDGTWDGGACFPAQMSDEERAAPGQPWTPTLHTLRLLRELGAAPEDERVRRAVSRAAEGCRWEQAGQAFFDGETEPCINGQTVAIGASFGQDVGAIVERLVGERLGDGGWNCWVEYGARVSSYATTICVVEGLLSWERARGDDDGTAAAAARAARRAGEEYLLERALFRRLSTGEVADPAWLTFSFPFYWHYDVLRALEHFRAAGSVAPDDPRLADALALVRAKRDADGRWPLENTHPGRIHFALEDGDGAPSRWNTLRALRVLRWADGG